MKISLKTLQIALGLTLSLVTGLTAHADESPPKSQGNPHYMITGGEVYDKKTDLTWARCSVGQHWSEGTGCVGVIKIFTFDDAKELENGTWRIPTMDELKALIDHERWGQNRNPAIDVVAFPDMDRDHLWYWSSTPFGTSQGWLVCFASGGDVTKKRNSNLYLAAVRLVRDGR